MLTLPAFRPRRTFCPWWRLNGIFKPSEQAHGGRCATISAAGFRPPYSGDLAQQATLASPSDGSDKPALAPAKGGSNEPFGMIGVQKAYWIGSKAMAEDYSPHVYLE